MKSNWLNPNKNLVGIKVSQLFSQAQAKSRDPTEWWTHHISAVSQPFEILGDFLGVKDLI